MRNGWIGVDLDGTLAQYDGWRGFDHIGAPVEAMVALVKSLVEDGHRVKIFTARMDSPRPDETRAFIDKWCLEHLGFAPEVTNVKDRWMTYLIDDRAVTCELNTGRICRCFERGFGI